MPDNKQNDKKFIKQWRDGELASYPGVATAALAIVLVLTLLAAKIIVIGRNAALQKQQQAIINAANLVSQVSQVGLEKYFGKKNIVRYYLFEKQGKPAFYGMTYLTPIILEDNTWIFNGADFRHDPTCNARLSIQYNVANDLSWYNYSQTFEMKRANGQAEFQLQQQKYKNGLFSGQYTVRTNTTPIHLTKIEAENLIPPPLLCFFASLAAQQNYSQGAMFTMIELEPTLTATPNPELRILQLPALWVTATNKIPRQITENNDAGQSVQIRQLPKDSIQIYHFDSQYQIDWQNSLTDPTIIRRAVTKEELLKQFPFAQQTLDRWLPTKDNEKNVLFF